MFLSSLALGPGVQTANCICASRCSLGSTVPCGSNGVLPSGRFPCCGACAIMRDRACRAAVRPLKWRGLGASATWLLWTSIRGRAGATGLPTAAFQSVRVGQVHAHEPG